MIEIGCGQSTRIIAHALKTNFHDYSVGFEHICIEPYEQPWLESFPEVKLIRTKVEQSGVDCASAVKSGDFVFIDSSHIVRPQGDVLHELLEIVPTLPSGVNVHVHDIFTPFDYLGELLVKNVSFWNEQYVLEALLSNSDRYRVLAALNLLKHEHFSELLAVCPFLTRESEPGSFYFYVA